MYVLYYLDVNFDLESFFSFSLGNGILIIF